MAIDTQIGVKTEVTYGTPLTVTKFSPLISSAAKLNVLKMESASRRSGRQFQRADANLSIPMNVKGDVVLPCYNRMLGIYLQHMLGAVATAGPADTTAYTHTFTVATLASLGLSMQVNSSLYSGTGQAFTWAGVKIVAWSIECNVQNEMTLTITINGASEATGTALAAASYPTGLEMLSWAAPGSGLTIAGTGVPATTWKLSGSNGLKEDDSRFGVPQVQPRANAFRDIDFSFTGEFGNLDFYSMFAATANADQYPDSPGIVFKIEAPSVVAGAATTKPSLTLTLPMPRVDDCTIPNQDMESTMQTVSGKIRDNGTDSPITAVYVTADSTP